MCAQPNPEGPEDTFPRGTVSSLGHDKQRSPSQSIGPQGTSDPYPSRDDPRVWQKQDMPLRGLDWQREVVTFQGLALEACRHVRHVPI